MFFIIMLSIHITLIIIWILLWLSDYMKPIHSINHTPIYTIEEFWDYQIKKHNIEDNYLNHFYGIIDPYHELYKDIKQLEKYLLDNKYSLITNIKCTEEKLINSRKHLRNTIIKLALNPRTKHIKL